jgi:hypothetical protein
MRFSICSGNHGNSTSITDTVTWLQRALQECGHRADINSGIEPRAVNLLIEHFVDEKALRELLEARRHGARYILIATEPIVGGVFNGGIENRHWHYGNADYWKLRFDAFKIAARMAEEIWVLAESMLPDYAALFPALPVRFLPHGHVVGLASVRQRPEPERDIDFYFSGSMTEHRTRILSELARQHVVVVDDQSTPEYLRQDHLARAKVCLSLRLSPRNRIPSVSRMHFHLQNRSFLLHEAYELPSLLDPFVLCAPSDDLVTWALGTLELPNRREIADSMHEKFKAALPMRRLLPPLLEATLSRNPPAPMARAA